MTGSLSQLNIDKFRFPELRIYIYIPGPYWSRKEDIKVRDDGRLLPEHGDRIISETQFKKAGRWVISKTQLLY
jgi:hypothetical protein